MTQYFPIIVEQEENGAFSAWVAGLPGVYAAADTAAVAKRAIRKALAAHLDALHKQGRSPSLTADVTVLRRDVSATTQRVSWRVVGVGALLGAGTSPRKARASALNGRLGGRPPRDGAANLTAIRGTAPRASAPGRRRPARLGAQKAR